MNRKQRRAKKNHASSVVPSPPLTAREMVVDALRHHKAGRLNEAERLYRKSLALDPHHADSLHLLGVMAHQVGRQDVAADLIKKAIAVNSKIVDYHYNLGLVLQAQGLLNEAVACYRKTIELNSDYPGAYNNLGNVLKNQGLLDEAVDCYRRAVALKPNLDEARYNLGLTLVMEGHVDEAIACYRRAISLKSDYAKAHDSLGSALKQQGQMAEAVACYRKAVALKPDYAEAHNNLGMALENQGRLDEAIACFRRALELKPHFVEALNNLLMSLHYSASHANSDILAQALSFGQRFERTDPSRNFGNTPDPGRRLRVGYVSADFRAHPVGYFLARVLAAHDWTSIEVFCYSHCPVADAMTGRLRAFADQWRSIVGVSDADAAAMIRQDGIDILVDLSGHTAMNRLPLFAARPAPVQVTWLGYFGTTGLAAMDYILADRFVVPPGEECFFTEAVWRLPDSYLCYAPPVADVPIIAEPAAVNRPLTLGCFNNWTKISSGTVSLWAEILSNMPDARLFLKTRSLSDPATRQEAIDRFAAHGIDPQRLILEAHAPQAELLAAYNRIDIALDPFPFGGGTTTAEALWMGVPVVTLRGDRWVGRVSESILTTVGLSDLVAADRDKYVGTVISLAADRSRLFKLRSELRAMMEGSPFCDGSRFARSIEAAYRGVWKAWCDQRAKEER